MVRCREKSEVALLIQTRRGLHSARCAASAAVRCGPSPPGKSSFRPLESNGTPLAHDKIDEHYLSVRPADLR
jgi:hypothetical protein